RQVDTSTHFCPNPDCAYRGWVGWGNLRANGHPNGGPWRQLLCVACRGYFLETLGTIFHGKRVAVELIVRVIACLAEGLGIRGTPLQSRRQPVPSHPSCPCPAARGGARWRGAPRARPDGVLARVGGARGAGRRQARAPAGAEWHGVGGRGRWKRPF